MQLKRFMAALALGCGVSAATAGTTTLTFDDALDDGVMFVEYGGASWSAYLKTDYGSGSNRYLHGPDIEAIFHSPIVFVATDYSSWGGSHTGRAYDLYMNGMLVYEGQSDQGYEMTWGHLASGYGGAVDRIVFYGSSDGAVIDNFTFSAPVPEPETYALFLAGFGLMGTIARRKSARS